MSKTSNNSQSFQNNTAKLVKLENEDPDKTNWVTCHFLNVCSFHLCDIAEFNAVWIKHYSDFSSFVAEGGYLLWLQTNLQTTYFRFFSFVAEDGYLLWLQTKLINSGVCIWY